MNKYIIRASLSLSAAILLGIVLGTTYTDEIFFTRLVAGFLSLQVGCCITEFCLSLISYHHALWTNQDQNEQKSQDGTK